MRIFCRFTPNRVSTVLNCMAPCRQSGDGEKQFYDAPSFIYGAFKNSGIQAGANREHASACSVLSVMVHPQTVLNMCTDSQRAAS